MSPELKILQTQFETHCAANKKEFSRIIEYIKSIDKKIIVMSENHLSHLEKDVSELKVNMSWVKKIQWFMFSTGITNLIGIIYLILNP